MAEIANKKARELQDLNDKLSRQLNQGESELRQRSNDVQRLKAEKERADKAIQNLARKSDVNKKEIEMFIRELERERRQTSTNQEGKGRQIKNMEEEKKRL